MGVKARKIRCLISAGPTREFFDPVRFMSNPSTGKMGYALAGAALKMGWQVDLVSGPVSLPAPDGAAIHRVVTGEEMLARIDPLFDACDILIMTAALMDYRPREYSAKKIKKSGQSWVVQLDPVVDILKTVAARKKDQLVVGFAAETENVTARGREKLVRKNADFIVANQVGTPGAGFAADTNFVTLIGHRGFSLDIGPACKHEIADQLIAAFATEIERPVVKP